VRRWSLSESIQVTVRLREEEREKKSNRRQELMLRAPTEKRTEQETGTRVGNSHNKRSNGVKRSGEQR